VIDLRDKVVLTTGASSGIGAAIAKEAAARGAMSVLVGRNAEQLAMVERSIRSEGGRSAGFVCNVSSAQEVERLQSRVALEVGVPDILINNAGGWPMGILEGFLVRRD
jgi:NAD(P)-dependent dehydrogenase (short-subunit alcohol dehydrogenase family)